MNLFTSGAFSNKHNELIKQLEESDLDSSEPKQIKRDIQAQLSRQNLSSVRTSLLSDGPNNEGRANWRNT